MYSLYLLAAIFVFYLLQLFIKGFTGTFVLVPATVLSQPWTLITSMFLHAPENFFHLFFNGFALYMFGPFLEQMIGSRRFLAVYFGSGLVGGLAYVASAYAGFLPLATPALGASGAIFGILGAVAVLRPDLQILMMGIIPMSMRQAAVFWVLLGLFDTVNVYGGVAGAAHLGGMAIGLLGGFYFLKHPVRHPDVG